MARLPIASFLLAVVLLLCQGVAADRSGRYTVRGGQRISSNRARGSAGHRSQRTTTNELHRELKMGMSKSMMSKSMTSKSKSMMSSSSSDLDRYYFDDVVVDDYYFNPPPMMNNMRMMMRRRRMMMMMMMNTGTPTLAPTTIAQGNNTLAPGNNNTLAPGNTTGTNTTTGNATARSGGGGPFGFGLDLSGLAADQQVRTLTVQSQIKFEFFTGNGAQPTTAEIDAIVAETKAFFDGIFQADTTFGPTFQGLTLENITPVFSDGDAQDVFELDFTALVGVNSQSLSNQDAANVMSGANFKDYISNFVWATPPLERSKFYDTHIVTFIATGTARR